MSDKPAHPFRKHGRRLWRVVRTLLYAAFAVVSAFGLVHAWTVKGTVDDRRAELVRLQEQLVEHQARGEQLQARLAAFGARSDVRIQTIRNELGMLREDEMFFVFR